MSTKAFQFKTPWYMKLLEFVFTGWGVAFLCALLAVIIFALLHDHEKVETIRLPSGEMGHLVHAHGMKTRLMMAGETCPLGYDVVTQDDDNMLFRCF